jgi:hypothetical protein
MRRSPKPAALHELHDYKLVAQVYDHQDSHNSMWARMFEKRLTSQIRCPAFPSAELTAFPYPNAPCEPSQFGLVSSHFETGHTRAILGISQTWRPYASALIHEY